jgi:hypothetical protein
MPDKCTAPAGDDLETPRRSVWTVDGFRRMLRCRPILLVGLGAALVVLTLLGLLLLRPRVPNVSSGDAEANSAWPSAGADHDQRPLETPNEPADDAARLSDTAIASSLDWIARQQLPDGGWRFDGRASSDVAATALALLPYLGASPAQGAEPHGAAVSRGLWWLANHQRPDGDLRADSASHLGMYAQSIAAAVLCEAFLWTGHDDWRRPAARAIDFLVQAQCPDGGWRGDLPHERAPADRLSNTSVLGWVLIALHSARTAGLDVPEETLELAGHYLDSAAHRDGAAYGYEPDGRPSRAMTAAALLCRLHLGWTTEHPALREGVRYLLEDQPPRAEDPDITYWYFATQAMHALGGSEWTQWRRPLRDVLLATQEQAGEAAGSWSPRGPHAIAGGRLYMTALAACVLEIERRPAPMPRATSRP